MIATLAVVCSVVAVPGASEVAAQESQPAVVLSTGSDGGLVWEGVADRGAIELEGGPVLEVGWDLRGLDAARYRSDLVQFRLDGVEGPGRFVATATSPFGDDEMLADSDAGVGEFVFQVGRSGAMRWSFDQPGTYRLALRATIPAVGGGAVTAAAAYHVSATAEPEPPRLLETSGVPLAARADAVAAAPRVVTSDEATYTFVVGAVGNTGGRLVLDVGHTDAIAPTLVDGQLVVQTKDDTQLHASGIVFRDPEDLIFQVLPGAEMPIPASAAFGFLGTPGDSVWMLPMAQDPALLWPGWSTEHASLAGEFDSIDFTITEVSGPGDFHLFLTDTFGSPIHRANSLGNLSNAWTERVPAHVHANWVFTQLGTYQITVRVAGAWLNAPDPQDPSGTTTTSSTTPGGGSSGSTTTTTSTAPGGGGSGGSTTTTTTATGGGGGRGGGGGPLANAGAAHLGATVTLGLAFLAVGFVLTRVRRRGRPDPAPQA